MASVTVDPAVWAEENFGACELGDKRRTKRLVQIASRQAERPDGSTPDQTESWGECKAVYRLMDCEDVSHANIIEQHCERTRRACPPGSVQLILCDTTEVDFGRPVEGLGPVGKEQGNKNGKGRGFFLHSGIMRDVATGIMSGIAGPSTTQFPQKKKTN